MLKNILNLKGAQQLSKNEQKSIKGGCAQGSPPVPPNHGICFIGGCRVVYHCDDLCPNGTQPYCNTY